LRAHLTFFVILQIICAQGLSFREYLFVNNTRL